MERATVTKVGAWYRQIIDSLCAPSLYAQDEEEADRLSYDWMHSLHRDPLAMEGMLYIKVLFSTQAHARKRTARHTAHLGPQLPDLRRRRPRR